jgi:hypothetical protein
LAGVPPMLSGRDHLVELLVDLIELVIGSARLVRRVGHDPEAPGPGHHSACAAFALRIEHRQMRIDSTHLPLARGLGEER